MSNKSYLCVSDYPDICPSLGMADFDPAIHVRAVGMYCIPLGWLAMFGADSLVSKKISVPGTEEHNLLPDGSVEVVRSNFYNYQVTAPIASRELCIERLDSNVPLLEKLLQLPAGDLAPHGAWLKTTLQQSIGEYVTLEMHEISCTEREAEFFAKLQMVLQWFDEIENPKAMHAARTFGDLDLNRPIGPLRHFAENYNLSDIDARNQENLIGSGYATELPH
jgi:hypothetical protein